jgi:DNA-binding FrmR family transcriptional regulator
MAAKAHTRRSGYHRRSAGDVPGAKSPHCGDSSMSVLTNAASRTDILNRLKRAEGQLRGVQRMIDEGEPCLKVAQQLSAVRKALDSTFVRMTVCFIEQELDARLEGSNAEKSSLDSMMEEMETLLARMS